MKKLTHVFMAAATVASFMTLSVETTFANDRERRVSQRHERRRQAETQRRSTPTRTTTRTTRTSPTRTTTRTTRTTPTRTTTRTTTRTHREVPSRSSYNERMRERRIATRRHDRTRAHRELNRERTYRSRYSYERSREVSENSREYRRYPGRYSYESSREINENSREYRHGRDYRYGNGDVVVSCAPETAETSIAAVERALINIMARPSFSSAHTFKSKVRGIMALSSDEGKFKAYLALANVRSNSEIYAFIGARSHQLSKYAKALGKKTNLKEPKALVVVKEIQSAINRQL